MGYQFKDDVGFATELDRNDPIRHAREYFYRNEGVIYLDGNSLGLCSKNAEKAVLKALDVWKRSGIGIWNVEDSKYFLYPSYLGGRIASLINADKNEVTVTNSTTINIHQCLSKIGRASGRERREVTDGSAS